MSLAKTRQDKERVWVARDRGRAQRREQGPQEFGKKGRGKKGGAKLRGGHTSVPSESPVLPCIGLFVWCMADGAVAVMTVMCARMCTREGGGYGGTGEPTESAAILSWVEQKCCGKASSSRVPWGGVIVLFSP